MTRPTRAKLLASSSLLALLGAGMLFTPFPASAQKLAPGEPYARAPITLAQSADTKPEADKLVPVPDTTQTPPPAAKDIGNAPLPEKNADAAPAAPAVTVVPPAPDAATAAAKPETSAPAAAAAEPAAPVPAVATLSAADQPIAEQIKQLLTTKAAKYLDRRGERAAVEKFYSERNYAPLWIDNGQANARATAAVAYLKTVDSDGLDPAEYATPEIKAGLDPAVLADAELKLTDAALTFARHAATGRVSFTRISNDMYYDLKFPEPAQVLAKLVSASNAGEDLASYLPQHPAYKALKTKYAEVRAKNEGAAPEPIPAGAMLKIVKAKPMDDPRVPLLRKRLGVTQNPDSTSYDQDVADAVKKFQAAHNLSADGVAGSSTINAINGPSRAKETDTILVNLERWRWIDHTLRGNTYVMVNIPDYTLKLVKDGQEYWKTRIVVGQPGKPTPLISPDMKFITVNPTWNVPPSIIAREYLPALREDPGVLDRIGLKMTHNPDGTVRIYQPPGERNALGRIRFNFPNKFLVYQHDTPDKNLFSKETRAYSHGCMRVQNPMTYAEKLLSIEHPGQNYTEAKIKSMLGSNEINIDFPKPLPVHITYQTAFVDEAGNLEFRNDIYGIDARMLKAMKTDERKVADVAVEQHGVGSATVSRDELRYSDPRGPQFEGFQNPFLALFGGARPDPQPTTRNNRRGRDARETHNTPNFFGLFR